MEFDEDGHSPQEYIVAQAGGWGVDTMMSNGVGSTADSGEDGAAIDAYNAYATAYNQSKTQREAKALADKLNAASQQIANLANSKVGSKEYLVSIAKGNYKAGTDKCNELVADVIEQSGQARPQVHYTNTGGLKGWIRSWFKRDPDANEWANPNVTIPGWSEPKPLSEARAGDVIAQAHGGWGHSGIVVAPGETVSVNTANPQMPGIVTRNNWGFRPRPGNGEGPKDPAPVVRHYVGP